MAETTHSKYFSKVKNYYDRGIWNETRVRNAVTHPAGKPWITAEEYKLITGNDYE